MAQEERFSNISDFDKVTFGKDWFVLSVPKNTGAICIDLEKTLLTDEGWISHIRQAEIDILTTYFGWTDPEKQFEIERHKYASALGIDKVSVSYMAQQYGLDINTWNRLKEERFLPEQFTFPEREVIIPLFSLITSRKKQLGIMSNTPSNIIRRILRHIGTPSDVSSQIRLFTADIFGISKPSKDFFNRVVHNFGKQTDEIVIIGDDPYKDLRLPFEMGMCTVYVRGPQQLNEAIIFLDKEN